MADQNPIKYMIMIVAIRFYLSLHLSSVTAIGSVSDNFLVWLTVFVIGIVPGYPVVFNTILFLALNGTLAVYLVLLLKRIANPLAN